MTKLTIDCEEFYNLAQCYRWEPVDAAKPFNALIDYIDARLAEAYEQGKKDAATWQPIETAPKDGQFIGCKQYDGNMDLAILREGGDGDFYHISRDKFISKSNWDFWIPLPKEPTE
jgi:hypothetical protein